MINVVGTHMGTPEQEAMAKAVITSDIGLYLGGHLFGLVFDALFLGIILCQASHWLPNWKHDKPTVRLLVCITLIASPVTSFFGWAMYMIDFVYNFGTYFHFVDFRLLGAYGLLQVCTTIPVQLLFVERAYRVNGNSKIILGTSFFLSACTYAGGLSVFIASRGVTMLDVPKATVVLFQYWPTACFVTHIFNTSTIIFGLMKARNGNERADRLLKRLIRGCLEAQVPATAYAFIGMVVICNDPSSALIPFLVETHAKVYLIGALAMVNSRHTWRKEGVTPQSYNLQQESGMTSAPAMTNSAPTATSSHVSSNRWPSTPPWGLEVEMGLTEDKDALKRDEEDAEEEKRSSLKQLSFMGGRGNN